MLSSTKIKKILLIMIIVTVVAVISLVVALAIVNSKIKKKEEDKPSAKTVQVIGTYYLFENDSKVDNVYFYFKADGSVVRAVDGKTTNGTYVATKKNDDVIMISFVIGDYKANGTLKEKTALTIDDKTFYLNGNGPTYDIAKVKSVYYAYDDSGNKLENEFVTIMDGDNGSVAYACQTETRSLGSIEKITLNDGTLVITFKPSVASENTFDGAIQKDNYGVLSIGDKKYYRDGKYCGNIKGEYHVYDENSLKQSNYIKIDTDGRYEYFKGNAKYYGVCEESGSDGNIVVTFVGSGGLTSGSIVDGKLTLKDDDKLYLDGKCPDPEYAFAFDICDDEQTGKTAKITSLIDTSAEKIVIPEFVVKNNTPYTVTAIGDEAFKDAAIKSIELPKHDIVMGNRAFSGSSIMSIVLYNSFNHDDGVGAFENCKSLETVTLSEDTVNIPDNAFSGCEILQTVNIPNSVGNIGVSAFENCSKLEKIDLSQTSVKTIGNDAFSKCSALVEVKLNDGVEKIGDSTLKDCTNLQSLMLPFVGKSIDENMHIGFLFGAEDFDGNEEFVPETLHTVTITRAIEITENAFYNCKNINTVVLPNTLVDIGNYAFYNTGLMTAPKFYDGLLVVGKKAFYTDVDNGITSIEFPKSLMYMGDHAIMGWKSLTEITLPFIGKSREKNGTDNSSRFKYIFDSSDSNSIPQTLATVNLTDERKINAYGFSGCEHISSIILPDTLESIGENAFAYCPLVNMSIPQSVTSIGKYIFYENKTLESLTVPFFGPSQSETKTMDYFFYMYQYRDKEGYNWSVPKTLKTVTVTNQSSFVDNTFVNCTSVISITLPEVENVTIGDIFVLCSSLVNLHLPKSITTINVYTFKTCKSLTVIDYGGTIDDWNNIDKETDWNKNCPKLKTVHCIDGVVDV